MPLDIIQQEIYTGSINIKAHSCDSPLSFSVWHLALHRIGCKHIYLTPSFPYFLPSPFLTCCAILPTSFGGNVPHLRRRLVAQPLDQTDS